MWQNVMCLGCERTNSEQLLCRANRDITDKTAKNFSGHLMAPDHEFGGIFARSVHPKLPEDIIKVPKNIRSSLILYPVNSSSNSAVLSVMSLLHQYMSQQMRTVWVF